MQSKQIYCSYINYYPDSSSMDSICIGLIFSDNISNSFLIDYSIKKIDKVNKIMGMDITFVTSSPTDAEAFALLKQFGLPFKNQKN